MVHSKPCLRGAEKPSDTRGNRVRILVRSAAAAPSAHAIAPAGFAKRPAQVVAERRKKVGQRTARPRGDEGLDGHAGQENILTQRGTRGLGQAEFDADMGACPGLDDRRGRNRGHDPVKIGQFARTQRRKVQTRHLTHMYDCHVIGVDANRQHGGQCGFDNLQDFAGCRYHSARPRDGQAMDDPADRRNQRSLGETLAQGLPAPQKIQTQQQGLRAVFLDRDLKPGRKTGKPGLALGHARQGFGGARLKACQRGGQPGLIALDRAQPGIGGQSPVDQAALPGDFGIEQGQFDPRFHRLTGKATQFRLDLQPLCRQLSGIIGVAGATRLEQAGLVLPGRHPGGIRAFDP